MKKIKKTIIMLCLSVILCANIFMPISQASKPIHPNTLTADPGGSSENNS